MMKNSEILKRIVFYAGFIILVSMIIMSLLYAVYLIPVEKIRPNAVKSVEIMKGTPENPRFLVKSPGMFFDTWTDSRMLNMAVFSGENGAFKDSLLTPRVYYRDPPYISFAVSAATQNSDDMQIKYYPRFWQGYLIFLKPLLVFFDLNQIRMINLSVQILLLCLVLVLMYKRLGFLQCAAFGCAMMFFNPINSWKCLEFATVIHLLLLSVLVILLSKNSRSDYLFFIIGVIETSFDWLSYPLVTLGIPLIIYVNLCLEGMRDSIKRVIKCSALWTVGYASMWSLKWAIGTMLTDYNVLEDAWDNILHRTYGFVYGEGPTNNLTWVNAVVTNLKEFAYEGSLIYILSFLCCCCGYFVFRPFKFKKNYQAFVLLGISLMPFVWYAGLVQHSLHHPWMAHKILVITIYAILSAVVCLFKVKPKAKNEI